MIALSGAIPSQAALVSVGGTANMLARWDRFVDTAQPYLTADTSKDARCWRFVCAPGILDAGPVSGVWRVSRTSRGNTYPVAVLTSDVAADASDPWFEAADPMLAGAIEYAHRLDHITAHLRQLPIMQKSTCREDGARFWFEDWEVHELYFPNIHDLAAGGFAQMLEPRPVLEDG